MGNTVKEVGRAVGKETGKQYVKVPHEVGAPPSKLLDPLVYANVRRFENRNTKEAFPSIRTIEKLSGVDRRTVQDSLFRMRGKFIDWRSDGTKRVYTFTQPNSHYEIFSMEFLDKDDLTPYEKAYLMKLQQFMLKDSKTIGKVAFSTKTLSDKLGLTEAAIRRYDRSLQDKGYLTVVRTRKKEKGTGAFITIRKYSMKLLKQSIAWNVDMSKKLSESNSGYIRKLKDNDKHASGVYDREKSKHVYKYSDITLVI